LFPELKNPFALTRNNIVASWNTKCVVICILMADFRLCLHIREQIFCSVGHW